jgi:hypothetical protein
VPELTSRRANGASANDSKPATLHAAAACLELRLELSFCQPGALERKKILYITDVNIIFYSHSHLLFGGPQRQIKIYKINL